MTALLSREVTDALYLHLQNVHSIKRDEVPYKIDMLCSVLTRIFGDASATTISKAVARRLFVKLGLVFPNSPPRTLSEYVEEAKLRNKEREVQL